MYFYQRLRDLRNDHDLSQKDVSKILGTSQQQYARWEIGHQELPMHNFIILAKYYNVSLDYLAGITDTPRTIVGLSYKL